MRRIAGRVGLAALLGLAACPAPAGAEGDGGLPLPAVHVLPVGAPAGAVPESPESSEPPEQTEPLLPAPVATAQPARDCLRRDSAGRFVGWVDYQHCVVSGRTVATALWFDDLFGDWHEDEASLLLRLIAEAGWDEEGGPATNLRLRGSAELPNAFTRLRLVISDDDADEAEPEGEVSEALGDFRDSASVALRWIPFSGLGFKTDVDVGVRSTPEAYVRWRLRQQWLIGSENLLRAGQTFRYGSERRGESVSQLQAERALDADSTLRLATAWRIEEEDTASGFAWSHGLSLQHAVGDDGSLSYGWSVGGITRPHYQRERHGPWLVWRQSLWRDWLFYEIEPRITYYRRLDWDDVPSLVLRLEAQIGR